MRRSTATVGPGSPGQANPTSASGHIRGSSLLLTGRVVALGMTFVAQVLIIRSLAKSDYGAFAYAMSLVMFAQAFMSLGLDRSLPRFAPIYDEQRAYGKLLGAIVIQVTAVSAVGLAIILGVYGLRSAIAGMMIGDGPALTLLLILILLAPIQALDDMLVALLAVFTRSRAIFFRRHLLAPGLRLAVVVVLATIHARVEFLAAGYVVAGGLGVLIYLPILVGILRPRFRKIRRSEIRFPVRELFFFALPVLSTDLAYIVIQTSDVVLLGWFRGADEVAAFRAVQPAALLNQVVFASFTLLFVPAASRLFARGDHDGIRELYWRTAIWMAIFSFPIFVLTFSLAGPLTVTLYEERYRASAVYLALLSCGYYFNAALGFNGLTLKVFGLLRYSVAINVAAAAINIALNLVLIPAYGALGAAIGTMTSLIIHNILKQAGLRLGTGIDLFEWQYLRVYVSILLGAAAVLGLQLWIHPAIYVGLAIACIASIVVFGLNRDLLQLETTFPELNRLPLAHLLLGRRANP